MNPNYNNDDEYLSLTINCNTEQEAMDIAMRTSKFKDLINMTYFDSQRMRVMKLRNRKNGEFFHYKGKE